MRFVHQRLVNQAPSCWFLSRDLLCAHARLRGRGVGVGGHAVLGEDGLKLLQRGVGSNPRRVEVSPTHPEASLRQVLKKLVQPVKTKRLNNNYKQK